jgi:alkylation response protein AidB-like acyl-CoA dehydrogenase
MDFSYNEIQAMLDHSVEKFIANDYDFETRQKYAASEKAYSPEVWQTFAELGWTSVPFSEDDGGFGGGPADLMVLMLRFGKGLVVEPYLANIVLAGGVLRRAADAEQKQKWLHPIIVGERQAALAYAEPQSRYDIGDVRMTATADGGGWVISGDKSVVFNGGNAELLIVSARTSGAQTDMDGITLFAVPANAERGRRGRRRGSRRTRQRFRRPRCRHRGCHARGIGRGRRHHAGHGGEDSGVLEEPHAVRRAHRQLPGPPAPHGGHVHRLRAELLAAAVGDDAGGARWR